MPELSLGAAPLKCSAQGVAGLALWWGPRVSEVKSPGDLNLSVSSQAVPTIANAARTCLFSLGVLQSLKMSPSQFYGLVHFTCAEGPACLPRTLWWWQQRQVPWMHCSTQPCPTPVLALRLRDCFTKDRQISLNIYGTQTSPCTQAHPPHANSTRPLHTQRDT